LASLDRLAALPDATAVCCAHEYTASNAAFALTVDPDNTALQARASAVRALRSEGRPTLPSTIALERATNPFLRCDTPALRAAIAARLGRAPADRVETFAELRRWKDGFRA
jgi:hydroxyacylglutathione hydrolase